jgi:hypothetical protein
MIQLNFNWFQFKGFSLLRKATSDLLFPSIIELLFILGSSAGFANFWCVQFLIKFFRRLKCTSELSDIRRRLYYINEN